MAWEMYNFVLKENMWALWNDFDDIICPTTNAMVNQTTGWIIANKVWSFSTQGSIKVLSSRLGKQILLPGK